MPTCLIPRAVHKENPVCTRIVCDIAYKSGSIIRSCICPAKWAGYYINSLCDRVVHRLTECDRAIDVIQIKRDIRCNVEYRLSTGSPMWFPATRDISTEWVSLNNIPYLRVCVKTIKTSVNHRNLHICTVYAHFMHGGRIDHSRTLAHHGRMRSQGQAYVLNCRIICKAFKLW